MLALKKLYYEIYAKKSYSLCIIDVVIDYIFKGIKKGIYIDIGCNHPIKHNNTYLLHKRGWRGINVDSDKTSIKLFNRYRKNDHNIRNIVSDNTDLKKLYFYHDRSAINTLSKELVDKRLIKPKKIIEEKSTTLNKIIENSPFKDKKINLLTIDVEGHEYNILKNFNFSNYKIDLIVVEFLEKKLDIVEIFKQSLDAVIKSNIYNLLTKNDYKLVNWIHSDLIFVKNDFKGM